MLGEEEADWVGGMVELTWLEGMEKGGLRFKRGGVGTGESSMAWA